ncbi:RcnB family protein [Sphingomonas sp. MMS12-HWE2-04]|uniref:RcnB family protein n=1 Tax=Sphingomonas sp. MMS12-HWE2-04 TaxID=3234199 RepID=UPI00384EA4CC
MKKTLLVAVIAATALIPPAALAQERGGRWGGRGGQSDGASQQRQSAPQDRGSWRQSNGGQQTQSVPAPQQQPQRQWNGGNRGGGQWNGGNRGGQWNGGQQSRGDWGQRGQGQLPQAQQAQAVPQQSRGDWNGNRGQQFRGDRNQWNGGQGAQRPRGDRNQWNSGSQSPQQFRGDRSPYRGDANRGDRGGQWNRGNRDWNGSSGWNCDNGYRGDRGGQWNNRWRNDGRYDWRGYRNGNRSLYRLPRYYAPSGWGYGYRRFGIGYTLSEMLFAPQYWINDPFYYRLPEAYGPYRWVRYYNDALLVDVDTGEVVDVINDIFW